MKKKAHVYALAFACEPGRGSEPGVGYAFAEGLARLALRGEYTITLLTRPHRIAAIKEALNASEIGGALVIKGIELPSWLIRVTGRKHVRWAYLVWQLLAVRYINRSLSEIATPVITHHVSFATEAVPTFEWRLNPSVVRLFGPAGSSQKLNESGNPGLRTKLRSGLRGMFGRMNLQGVEAAIAQNDTVSDRFRIMGAKNVRVEPNIVVDESMLLDADTASVTSSVPPYELVCVGLLVELKRQHLALESLARLEDKSLRLLIVGDGPLRQRLEAYADELGVRERVQFVGMLPRAETLRYIAEAHVLLHPSRQEGAPWVVGEAQSLGTTPVVFKDSGADTIVRLADNGEIAPLDNLDCFVDAVSRALSRVPLKSDRWHASRLPGMLDDWYQEALLERSRP